MLNEILNSLNLTNTNTLKLISLYLSVITLNIDLAVVQAFCVNSNKEEYWQNENRQRND